MWIPGADSGNQRCQQEKFFRGGRKTALDRVFPGPYSPPRHDGQHMGGLEGASRRGRELLLLKCLHESRVGQTKG